MTQANVVKVDFDSMTENNLTLNVDDIKELIPHRYPFLFVDSMKDIVLGEKATGIKQVSVNEWFFQGHFPEYPILPGVIIVEAMAQTAGALVVKSVQEQMPDKKFDKVYFMSIEGAKFRNPVRPGDTLEMKVKKIKGRGQIWKFEGKAYVNDTLVSEATFTAMIAN